MDFGGARGQVGHAEFSYSNTLFTTCLNTNKSPPNSRFCLRGLDTSKVKVFKVTNKNL